MISGHGSVSRGEHEVRTRIGVDRAYVQALRDGQPSDDVRIGSSASFGADWLPAIYEWQFEQLAPKG